MSVPQIKYELLKKETSSRHHHIYIQICLLVTLCILSSIAVFATWTLIYRNQLNIPPKLNDIPDWWLNRAIYYAKHFHNSTEIYRNPPEDPTKNITFTKLGIKQLDNETIYPSKYGNFIYKPKDTINSPKLVCYYYTPSEGVINPLYLYPNHIDPHICTHINIGIVPIENNRLVVDQRLKSMFKQIVLLQEENRNLKILIWVGGFGTYGFTEMVQNHTNRKQFIQSLKFTLETYRLDGIDLDWEFPTSSNRERQHLSQLLHEIRREYQREHRTYLLSLAVAAPEGIAYFAYDIAELNNYADFVNIMTYDYHFYSDRTPFTGLNAPLYKKKNENSIISTLNINASVSFWHNSGLDKSKIIIGLPSYGHSFRLINPFNTKIGSPSSGYGNVGDKGFLSYSELCWFKKNNYFVSYVYDEETCSPYLYAGTEWISYEDEKSIECKTNYIKSNGFGGAMVFSLNSDDYLFYCTDRNENHSKNQFNKFPLTRKINSVLFN